MKLANLINKQIDFAFKALGDLLVSVVITRHQPSTFDFATLGKTEGDATTLTIRGVMTNRQRRTNTRNSAQEPQSGTYNGVILKTKDIADANIGDSLVIDGETWNVVPPFSQDGFLTTIEVVKSS